MTPQLDAYIGPFIAALTVLLVMAAKEWSDRIGRRKLAEDLADAKAKIAAELVVTQEKQDKKADHIIALADGNLSQTNAKLDVANAKIGQLERMMQQLAEERKIAITAITPALKPDSSGEAQN